MADSAPTLSELASKISTTAAAIESYLKSNNLPQPTFHEDGPLTLPHAPEVAMAKMQLLELLSDMQILVQGPIEATTIYCMQTIHDQAVLNVLNQFSFWDAVPLSGSASYAQIATAVNLGESTVRRLLRHAMTRHVFAESPAPGSGVIVHTSLSALCVRQPLVRSWLAHNLEDVGLASQALPDALRAWGESDESGDPTHSAAGLTFLKHGEKSLWDFFAEDEDRQRGLPKGYRDSRFGEAMTCITSDPSFNLSAVHDMFGWDALEAGSTVVDIGGSAGHVSVEIASRHPNLHLIVQDRPHLLANFSAVVPARLRPRITFQPHDFFAPQPVRQATVYFLKHILHDWSDAYAARILARIVPAMGPGSRIVLLEGLMPPPGEASWAVTRMMSSLDLQMLTALNAKERSPEDWAALCRMADERLVVREIRQRPGIAFAMIEIVLKQ